jgi:tetratricopeptide (TPR) repeat protein
MSDPMVANPGAKSSLGDIVGDSGSEARLAQIAGVMGMGEGGRRFKSSKQEAVIRHLRRALKMLAVGDAAGAVKAATAALKLDEHHGQAWHVMAIALEKTGNLQNAFAAFEAAVKLLPDDWAIIDDLGSLANRLGYLDLAEKLYQKCLAADPGNLDVANNLACVLRDANRYDEAIELLKAVIAAHPQSALLWNTLGTVLSDKGDMEQSVIFFEESLRLDPGFQKARYNLANVRVALGEPEQGLADINKAIRGSRLPMEIATMKTAKALTQMILGDLAGAFETYEARFDPSLKEAVEFHAFGKRWSPDDDLQGATLLIYGEQGLGDEILFANLLGDVIDAVGPDGRVLLAISDRLLTLFSRSYPTLVVHSYRTQSRLGRTERSVEFGGEAPAIDLWTPIGSLFRRFRRAKAQFPDTPAFLKADPDRVAHWRDVLQSRNAAPKVGFMWKSLNMSGSRARGFSPFDLWQSVLGTKGVEFVNLQYGDCSAELAQAQAAGLDVWTPPGIDLKQDLDDVAALCSALDLMVAPMTATTNIAAACGVPTWVIAAPDAWPRFGTDGFPCYPSVRLFPTDGFGQWSGVMERIKQALSEEVAGRGVRTAAAA